MSLHRITNLAILAFWAVSMSWFAYRHLGVFSSNLPAPLPQEILPTDVGRLEPIRWRLLLDNRPIGWAMHQVRRQIDGYGEITSTVRIERLAIDHILQQGVGSFGALIMRGIGQGNSELPDQLSMTVDNVLRFDEYGQAQSFSCQVVEDSWGECIHLQGAFEDDRLQVKAFLILGENPEESRRKPIYKTSVRLPADRLVVDSFAPNPQMSGLRVGQRWTLQTYRPLFPTSPLQTVDAEVVGRELVQLPEGEVTAFRVSYERGAGEPLSWERHLGDAWVLDDGTVVRQTVTWGQFTLTFERVTAPLLSTESR